MKCSTCDGENRDGAHFCRHCGAHLVEPSVSEAPVAPEAAQPLPQAPAHEDEDLGAEAGDSLSAALPADTPSAEAGSEVESRDEWEANAGCEGHEDTVAPQAEIDAQAAVEDSAVEGQGAVDLDQALEIDPVDQAPDAGTEEPLLEPEAEEPASEAGLEHASPELQEDIALEPAGYEDGVEVLPPPEWLEDQDLDSTVETEDQLPGFWRDEAESLEPVVEGTVVADRYMVSDVLDVQETTILYYARDLWRCWQCGFAGNGPTEAFCAQCGASLERKPSVRLLEVGDAEALPSAGEIVADRLVHEDRTFLILAEPEPERHAPPERNSIRFLVGQRSDVGQVRELDEDSLLSLTLAPTYGSRSGPILGLFAVADGMGGHEGGEVASKLALQVLAQQVTNTVFLPELKGEFRLDEDLVVRLRQAVMIVNDEVYLARQKRGNDMGTTLTAALIRDNRLYLAHVGDCRAYRWNADGLEQLTVDHSMVASMIATGKAAPEEIYTHPHRSVIYRCIGDQPTVQVDTDVLRLEVGDRIIICCDGLWEMVRSEGIEDVMLEESEPQAACDLLVSRANLAGGDDNISVLIVRLEAV